MNGLTDMKKVTIYTTSICGYCVMAKRLLSQLDIEFEEVNVGLDAGKRRWLVEMTGQRTVPQVFIGDESIGGYTELAALHRSCGLEEKLCGTE
jgi:glutaredoxin 3